jgi:hypothetical protein
VSLGFVAQSLPQRKNAIGEKRVATQFIKMLTSYSGALYIPESLAFGNREVTLLVQAEGE